MIGWLVVIVIATVLIAVLASNLEVKIRIRRAGQDDRWKVHCRWLYGLVKYSIKIPALRFKGLEGLQVEEKQVNDRSHKVVNELKPKVDANLVMQDYRKYMQMLRNTFEFSRWIKDTISHVRCKELGWQTHIGTGDAVETATLTGLAWSLKGSLVGYASGRIKLQVQPKLNITPHYNEKLFTTDFNCILKIRTGYAMIAGLLLLVRILRIKGGMKTWRNILFKAS